MSENNSSNQNDSSPSPDLNTTSETDQQPYEHEYEYEYGDEDVPGEVNIEMSSVSRNNSVETKKTENNTEKTSNANEPDTENNDSQNSPHTNSNPSPPTPSSNTEHSSSMFSRFSKRFSQIASPVSPGSKDSFGKKGAYLQWENVSWTIHSKKRRFPRFYQVERKAEHVLKGVSGEARPGELVAVVGSSGAGKTSLMNLLAGRIQKGTMSGEISINRERVDANHMRSILSYVTQEDIMMETLTPREILKFRAMIGLPNSMSNKQKMERVDKVIQDLNLEHCQKRLVGTPGLKKVLSGGERKRVNIGLSLLSDPRIVFLDEPTSGLDTSTAHSIMRLLAKLSHEQGKTVMTTIHQPSSRIFSLFDRLVVLAKGQVVYCGPSRDVVPYFESVGFKCKPFANPADHAIELVNENEEYLNTVFHKMQNREERVEYLIEQWKEFSAISTQTLGSKVNLYDGEEDGEHLGSDKIQKPTPFFTQLKWLIWRAFKATFREKLMTRNRVGQTILISVVGGLIFWQLPANQKGIRDRQGGLFFLTMQQVLQSLISILFVFPKEQTVFLRESKDGLYGIFPYYLSKLATDFPLQTFFPWMYATILFFMMGLQMEVLNYVYFCCAMMMASLSSSATALILSTITNDLSQALALLPAFFVPMILFSNFFISLDTVPEYLRWLNYFSFLKYAVNTIFISEFTGLEIDCSDGGFVITPEGEQVCPYTDGEQVLDDLFDIGDVTIWEGFVALGGFVIGLRVLGYFLLRLSARMKKKQS